MARRSLLQCDFCEQDVDVPSGTAETIRIDLGDGPHEIEACPPCQEEHIGPVAKVVKARGRDMSSVANEREALRCTWCRTVRKTLRGIQDHVDTEHPERAQQFLDILTGQGRKARRRASDDEPVVVRQVESDSDGKVPCKICGKPVGRRGGLAAHMSWHGRQGDT